jgi:predicted TIM-barrel fold metal-dependent hydrolase
VRDPDVAYALARAYNDWIVDFCKAAPERLFAAAILPLQNMDFALEELARVAQIPSVRAVFIRPMFVEERYLNHPYFDPLWAELERLGITAAVHPTPGLWNPEWTSHGPFFEKIKDRLVHPIVPGGGGGPLAGGSGGAGQTTTFTGATPLGHPMAPILANWLDNHMFVASTLIGYTVMERYPAMKVVVAHGKASWMHAHLGLGASAFKTAAVCCITGSRRRPRPAPGGQGWPIAPRGQSCSSAKAGRSSAAANRHICQIPRAV